jgi:hypothetical protein
MNEDSKLPVKPALQPVWHGLQARDKGGLAKGRGGASYHPNPGDC